MYEQKLKEEIVEVGRRLHAGGYIAATDGNISVRLEDGTILTTPTGVNKGFMKPDMIVKVDSEGRKIEGRLNPSSELAMHLLIYQERPDINSVVHAHPPFATGFAAAGIALDKALVSEVVLTLGCIPLAGYGTPSTYELTDALKPYLKHHDAILMANHGAVAYGPTLEKASWRMETLEHFAKITLVARLLGRENQLSGEDLAKLFDVRERAGLMPPEARYCQSCPYIAGEGSSCGSPASGASYNGVMNGDEKITLTKNELINLITEAARLLR